MARSSHLLAEMATLIVRVREYKFDMPVLCVCTRYVRMSCVWVANEFAEMNWI